MTIQHLENLIKEMEKELKHIQGMLNKEYKSFQAYALSGRALTFRRIISPLKGFEINKLYERLEVITNEASQMINPN